MTNALINARKAVDKDKAGEIENVPIVSTSVAYGVYMAVSSNLRYFIFIRISLLSIAGMIFLLDNAFPVSNFLNSL